MEKYGIKLLVPNKNMAWCAFLFIVSFLSFPETIAARERKVSVEASQAQEKKVTLKITDQTLVSILSEIKKQTGLDYGFKDNRNATSNERYSINVRDMAVGEALNTLLKDSKFTYEIIANVILIVEKQRQQMTERAKNQVTVSGRVTDKKGEPIVGATVVIHGTTQGVATDAEGRYRLQANPDDVLRISFIGYKTEVLPLKGETTMNATLQPEAENLEEVTVVAFGEQKKESVVSAITSVNVKDLKTSNSDLTASFAGRIPGIVGWQTGGLPGALTEEEMNTKFYVRGITSFQTGANIDPLILIDGVESSKLDLARIPVEDIESFSVMKDASATAMYGARGANGVIMVTTKKGEAGSVYTSVRYEAIASMPTRKIDVVDPVTYMRMYNEAITSRFPLMTPRYSVEDIERTASGKYPDWVYPRNDWYKTLFKDYNVNHHMGLSLRGGSEVVQYYASVTHNRDQGAIKTDRLNQFDVNVKNNTTSLRMNLNVDLKAGIRLLFNTSTNMDQYHGPVQKVNEAYYLAFNASPVDYAPLYPADDTYSWPHLRFGNRSGGLGNNPYMDIHSGYIDRQRFSTTNRAEYIQNLSSLIKGLELRASVSLVHSSYHANAYKNAPFRYALADYDFETGKHKLEAIRPQLSKRTLRYDGLNSGRNTETQVTYEGRLYHSAAWGGADNNLHQTSLTAVLQAQDRRSSVGETILASFPERNLGLSMRATYGFKDRYFIEGSFGYNGSERFSDERRMGFFPAGGLAWLVSSEKFMEPVSAIIPYLKLRFSYGQVGNDGIINEPRFVYLPTIEKNKEYEFDPEPNSKSTQWKRYQVIAYANNNIKWEVAEQYNLGLDFQLFNGLVDVTVDAYEQIRHNILDRRVVMPFNMGFEVAPLDNIGKVRSRGVDFSGKLQHAFNKDCWFILNTTMTYNKSTFLEIEEAIDKPVWQLRKGHDISQQVGYIAEGLFKDQAEIDNSPRQSGNVMPGDIRYRDLNNDGVINVKDATHIGYPTTPRMTYGFNAFINYKNWEFSFAFQGSGKRTFFMDPSRLSPFYGDHAMLKAIYEDHWSQDNMSNKPFWPRLSPNNLLTHNAEENRADGVERRFSTYFMRECRFLRCTSIELAYNMPKKLMDRWRLKGIKFYARANNPFIITNFKVWDVELGDNGFNYPIQKTFSAGLNLNF